MVSFEEADAAGSEVETAAGGTDTAELLAGSDAAVVPWFMLWLATRKIELETAGSASPVNCTTAYRLQL